MNLSKQIQVLYFWISYWISHVLNLPVIYLMTLGMLGNRCNFFRPWHLSNGHSSIIEYISPLLKYGPVAFIVKTWSLSFLFFHFFNMVKIELLISSYSFQTISYFQNRNCVQLPRKRAPSVGEIETKQEGEEGAKTALTKAILSWIISLLMKSY